MPSVHLISLRHFLLSVVVALGAQATQSLAAHAAGEPKRVVFVCAHGSVKSLVAAVYFKLGVPTMPELRWVALVEALARGSP